MADKIISIPGAKRTISALRDLGYNLNSAVADILDNSISRGEAKNIYINFNKDTVPTLIQCYLIEDLEQIVKTNITFINLDIEGGEYIVLPAMQNWLALRKPVLLLSLHPGFLLSEKHRRQIKFVRYLRRYWEQRKIFNSITRNMWN